MPDKMFVGKVKSVDVAAAASASDQFTDEVRIKDRGVVDIENTGGASLGMIGTVTLQYRTDMGETWMTRATYAVGATFMGRQEFNGFGDRHRVGIEVANISSGTATLHIKG
jgi:hypothetical protein